MIDMRNKGSSYIFYAFLLGLFILAWMWLLVDKGMADVIKVRTYDILLNESDNSSIAQKSYSTLQTLNLIWDNFILILIVLFIFGTLIEAQKRGVSFGI